MSGEAKRPLISRLAFLCLYPGVGGQIRKGRQKDLGPFYSGWRESRRLALRS